jgi:acetyl esterase/lipase
MIAKTVSYANSAAAVVALLLAAAAALPAQNNVIPLWPNGAPGSENWTQKEIEYTSARSGLKEIRNVVKPSITVYLPPAESATGTAVVVAPGGAFRVLAWESEGTMVAEWLQRHGVAAFLLKYRLVDTGTAEEFAQAENAMGGGAGRGGRGADAGRGAGAPAAAGRGAAPSRGGAPVRGGIPSMDSPIVAMSVTDSLKAIEVVRARATEWKIDPAKVGIIGFSAGGWASVMAGIQHTAANRPSFVGAIYACCFNPPNPLNATNIKVPDDAPPAFFLHAYDDFISASSPTLFLAWQAAKRPAELHSLAAGGHGFGLVKHNLPSDGWIEPFVSWLRYQKLLK